ncbi:hypothetical protein GCM10009744_29880 [Kribbella alba]|uniref:Uncharacterized protein n=1 Tax=Kribbella alba TaxID=190197 RepID=A0ABN2FAZ2_9ACTN
MALIHHWPPRRFAAFPSAGRLANRVRRLRLIVLAGAFLAISAVGSGLVAQAVNGSPNLRRSLPFVLYAFFACLSLLVLRAGTQPKRRGLEDARPSRRTVND